MYKIWDNKYNYYCLTVYSEEQAEIMARHFAEMDFVTGDYIIGRYRIDGPTN